MKLNIKDTFNVELPADPILENNRRQVFDSAFSFVSPKNATRPKLVHASKEVAELLGISENDVSSQEFLDQFSGNKNIQGSHPYAMCYGGHQFGNWAGQLGDGRAINLGEVLHNNQRWAIQLKGSGATPYSRSGDGLAVLRSSIREHLCSEAMYHLGVPTTRSLSLMLSGDQVMRDMLYNGNPAYEKGAIVCRVANSFLRFGNYEIFASRRDTATLKKVLDYTLKYFYPDCEIGKTEGYLSFYRQVSQRTLDMIIHWQRVGFVHGVMNTDNMSILGQTIDYGPYGWLEVYDPNWTPNTTDSGQKRYRFGSQIEMGFWNLIQLANAIYPLIGEAKGLESILKEYKRDYVLKYELMMKSKLGLQLFDSKDESLIKELEACLQLVETDMTIFYRLLANFSTDILVDDFGDFLSFIQEAFYDPEHVRGGILIRWTEWFETYKRRLSKETLKDKDRKILMNKINPKFVFRNYMAQLTIEAADKGDYSLIDKMHKMLQHPYSEQIENEKWFAKRPEWARNKIGCSMLSCSS